MSPKLICTTKLFLYVMGMHHRICIYYIFNHVYYIFESIPKVKNKNKTNIFKFVLSGLQEYIVYNSRSGWQIKIVTENTANL